MAFNAPDRAWLYGLLAALLLSLAVVSGCGGDECSQSADCPGGQICSESGGLFWSGNICVQLTPRDDASSGDFDATDASDAAEDTTPLEDIDDVDPPPSCDDAVKNGDETDVDCGGATCTACQLGQSCSVDQDCITAHCAQNQCARGPFKTVWNTENPGGSDDNTIHLPLVERGNYDFQVDWGDGSEDVITQSDQPEVTHTYAAPGEYTVSISGLLRGWRFEAQDPAKNDAEKLLRIENWGIFHLGTPENYPPHKDRGYFAGAKNLTISATDILDLEGVEDFTAMFQLCAALEDIPAINQWDVSSVNDMQYMFDGARQFNADISAWDVSSVTNMTAMFRDAEHFNADVSGWDVSSVVRMPAVFLTAKAFNQDLSGWDVSSVTNMTQMFMEAESFNQDLSKWDVSSVTDMWAMFLAASTFDQDLSKWDVSSVSSMGRMLSSTALSTANYDATLIGWSSQTVQPDVSLGASNLKYSPAAENARDILTGAPNNWSISDAGLQ